MKTIKLILTVLTLLLNFSMMGTELKWKIVGKILEENTETTIPYVTVVLENIIDNSIATGTVTDGTGSFEISKIKKGDYLVKISFIGYKEIAIDLKNLNESKQEIDLGTIRLFPSAEQLEDVEITARIAPISKSIDKQVINVEKNLSAQGGTAADALTLSPSIQADPNGGVKLRGSANFKVLINGRPTSLDPNEVLKQTPANQINRIEVITNPSVKYSAEGGAGIINIILKKGISSGFNGIINAGIGTRNKYNADANFNLNKKMTSYSFGMEWRDETKTSYNNYYRDFYNESNIHKATMLQDRRISTGSKGFRFGLEHVLNEKQSLTYALHTGQNFADGNIKVKTGGYTLPATTEEHRYNTFYINQRPTFFTNNLGYSIQLNDKGSSLSANVYYSYIDYYLYNDQVLTMTDTQGNFIDDAPYKQEVLNNNNSHDLRLESDFTAVINETTNLETGFSFQRYNRFLDITYAQFNYDVNTWQNNPLYTNKYNFDEDIFGIYANLNTKIWNIKSSLGFRMEYTDRILKRKLSNESYDYNKVNFFPGFSFSKELDDFQSLKLSLSNRINRPDEYMMNPFPEFEDDYFYAEGNPYLIPEIVRNAELGYQLSKKGIMFSTNLYYKKTKDKLEQKLTIGDEDKIHTIFHNDSKDRSIGTELMMNISPMNWWSVNANMNLYHYKITASIDGISTIRKDYSWSSQLVNSITINNNTSLQVIGYYQNKTVRSQGELSSFYFVDLALKRKFLNGRLSVNIQLKDVFQSLNYELFTETENMKLLGDFNNESPIFKFNISYTLSNYKKKTKDVETEFDM